MKISKLLVLLGVMVFVGACTPASRNNTNQEIAPEQQDQQELDNFDNSIEGKEDISSAVRFLDYENRAVGYKIKIPTTWYWQHFIKSQIGDAYPEVDNYLFISPSKPVVSVSSGLNSEMAFEVSSKNLEEVKDESLAEVSGTVAGQSAVKLYGEVDGKRKIQYLFTKDGKTFQFSYLAPVDMTANERIFEEIVKSFSFND
jgi:hypothetical protein